MNQLHIDIHVNYSILRTHESSAGFLFNTEYIFYGKGYLYGCTEVGFMKTHYLYIHTPPQTRAIDANQHLSSELKPFDIKHRPAPISRIYLHCATDPTDSDNDSLYPLWMFQAFKQAEIKNIIYWAFDFAAVRIKNRRVKCQAESRSSSSSERILDLSPFTGAAVALVTAASE
ncbi:uncharacterized protein LOC141622292 isoform X1 [Silene latifolia]|uniref:uncharacterized protein LOC141622292 isoform X1 n=1 Tax=Silene latifolia TaxID=37657 RepID=UPI003D783623